MLLLEFLTKNKTVIMPQPPYSPDLAPANFFLLPKLKTPMKEQCFATIEEIKEKSKQELLTIPKSAFQKCFELVFQVDITLRTNFFFVSFLNN